MQMLMFDVSCSKSTGKDRSVYRNGCFRQLIFIVSDRRSGLRKPHRKSEIVSFSLAVKNAL